MASNILKFHPSNLITGINVVDDMLFFTDGVNEPKKIDLDIFRAADHSSGNTVVYGRNFQERDITVIRPHPQTAINTSISNSTAVIDPSTNVACAGIEMLKLEKQSLSAIAPVGMSTTS